MSSVFDSFKGYPDAIYYKALILLHKFFRKFSIKQLKHDKGLVGTACMFLAGKQDDFPMKLTELAASYHKAELLRVGWPMKPLTDQQKFQIQSKICELESEILRVIGFDLELELPQKYLHQYRQYPYPEMGQILDIATCFCNDSFLKPLCLYYHPAQIACGCIFLACLFTKKTPPDANGTPWYKFIHPDIQLRHLQEVGDIMKMIYAKMEERKKQAAAHQSAKPTGSAGASSPASTTGTSSAPTKPSSENPSTTGP